MAKGKKISKKHADEEPEAVDEGIAFPGTVAFPGGEESDGSASDDDAERPRKNKGKTGGFQSMGLTPAVYRSVMRKGYRIPTPIQRRAIPAIMSGRDVVAMARTGSGKTAAFLIPMLEKLGSHSATVGVRGIVLSPTRELAVQTHKFSIELSHFTDPPLRESPLTLLSARPRFIHVYSDLQRTRSA